MKDKTHPDYYPNAKVVCACGNTFTTGSTQEQINVDICSACHPFFTGQMKYVDSGGRVKRFEERMKKAQQGGQRSGQSKQGQSDKDTTTKTLKEMLQEAQ